MKKMGVIATVLVVIVYVMVLFSSNPAVMAASGTITTNVPIYPIWGLGGTVTVKVQNFAPNLTYYLWLQKPKQPVPAPLSVHFTMVNSGIQPSISLAITAQDPAGTYTLSVSSSAAVDTIDAIVHFGVSGTNSQTYERTTTVSVSGGGFAANSSISVVVTIGNRTFPNFPLNVTTDQYGDYTYSFKLTPSATTGALKAAVTGPGFDRHAATSTSSTFTVIPAPITVKATNNPPPSLQRTAPVNATYTISYPDGSPVSAANGTVNIIAAGKTLATLPLRPANATTGEWAATWVPPPSANTTITYQFALSPANLVDPYGNTGQGTIVASKSFKVVPATLQPTIRTNTVIQRTQNASITISALYLDGANVANITKSTVGVTEPNGTQLKPSVSVVGPQAATSFKIPVNATLGNWTVQYSFQDPWNNSASGKLTVQVIAASPVFLLNTPATVQRTTSLNVTTRISYPDGSLWNKTITMSISHGNLTVTPILSFNSTTFEWSGSYYLVQNATLGAYNITWSASDSYGNAGAINSTTTVIPAQFNFYLRSNNSTVAAFTNLDLPVKVSYPNGTLLPATFGNVSFANVTASYQNSTGYIFTSPLAYNATNGTWHMYFFAPDQGNFTFSFTANDRFANTGMAADAYMLKVNPSVHVLSQRLIIAGVIGALVPTAVLVWAIIAISTRRRKHKP